MSNQPGGVCLISMPWAPPTEPSLGLAILKASLQQNGTFCTVFHAAPSLLRWISIETYEFISGCWGISEFLFTAPLDPLCDDIQLNRLVERSERYVKAKRHPRYTTVESMCELFLKVRHDITPKFFTECINHILQLHPSIVGFTCMFDQTLASVALAKMLKEERPDLTIVLGGYALESCAENLLASFPWLDYIVLGDGERAILDFVKRTSKASYKDAPPEAEYLRDSGSKPTGSALGYHEVNAQEGHLSRSQQIKSVHSPKELLVLDAEANKPNEQRIIRAQKIDLNESPSPDFSDWFLDVANLAQQHKVKIKTRVLPVEGSRGCWWGELKHCIFCGIDDETMKYRVKHPSKTLHMLRELRSSYGDHVFRFVDYIMPKSYYAELLPLLVGESPRFRLEGEIKANHPSERVRLLAKAGFLAVQPGIESFSTQVLKNMEKGVRGIDNVSLLKCGYVNRLVIYYNLLYGLPSDTVDDYLKMAEGIPKLYHLIPPCSRNEIVITRFAPLQTRPERFDIKSTPRPHPSYEVLFSRDYILKSGFSLPSYAYYFDRNFMYEPDLELIYHQITLQIDHWKSQHQTRFVELSYCPTNRGLQFIDSRFQNEEESYELSGLSAAVYLACDRNPTTIKHLIERLSKEYDFTSEQISSSLRELDDHRLLWRENDHVLGLAIPKEVCDLHRSTQWPQTAWTSLFI